MGRHYSAELVSDTQLPKGAVHLTPSKVTAPPKEGRGFIGRETRQYLTNMQPGDYYLLPDAFAGLPDEGATAHVNIHPEKRYTREESRNFVRFGQLVINNDPTRRERVADVAVKPLNTPALAAREFGAMSTINALAQQGKMSPSLNTLGFYRNSEDGRITLLTEYEPDILTLDNLFWDPNFKASDTIVHTALSHCALSLAELHIHGMAHGDAQVKNIGVDNRGIRYVDLEGAQEFINSSGVVSPFSAQRLMEIDVRTCLDSLGPVRPDQIEESFTPVYLDRIASADLLPHGAQLTAQTISNLM